MIGQEDMIRKKVKDTDCPKDIDKSLLSVGWLEALI